MELNAVLRACAPDQRSYATAEEMHADLALLHSGDRSNAGINSTASSRLRSKWAPWRRRNAPGRRGLALATAADAKDDSAGR
jgi:hypothetical protein